MIRTQKHPDTYSIADYTSHRFELLGEFEILLSAERDNLFYLIWDNRLNEDWFAEESESVQPPVTIWEFHSSDEREAHLQENFSHIFHEENPRRHIALRFNTSRGYR